jgi:hypothetical protein
MHLQDPWVTAMSLLQITDEQMNYVLHECLRDASITKSMSQQSFKIGFSTIRLMFMCLGRDAAESSPEKVDIGPMRSVQYVRLQNPCTDSLRKAIDQKVNNYLP